mgnify:CR=1 FL=1
MKLESRKNINVSLCSVLGAKTRFAPPWQSSRFIFDHPGNYFFFCPLWGKKYFRLAGGKAEI